MREISQYSHVINPITSLCSSKSVNTFQTDVFNNCLDKFSNKNIPEFSDHLVRGLKTADYKIGMRRCMLASLASSNSDINVFQKF